MVILTAPRTAHKTRNKNEILLAVNDFFLRHLCDLLFTVSAVYLLLWLQESLDNLVTTKLWCCCLLLN